MAPPTLIYVHVRRTGGNTVTRWIGHRCADVGAPYVVAPTESRIPPVPSRTGALVGHLRYGEADRALAPGEPFAYAVTLRDPVDRVVSWYEHCRALDLHGVRRDDVRFFEFVDRMTAAHNGMVRHLADEGGCSPDARSLRRAQASLLRCVAVGHPGGLVAFARRIARALDWPEPAAEDLERSNAAPGARGEDAPEAWRAYAAQRNRLDAALWAWARDEGVLA